MEPDPLMSRLAKQAWVSAFIMGLATRSFFDIGSTKAEIIGYSLLCIVGSFPIAYGVAYIFERDGRGRRPQSTHAPDDP
jgi:hypothetical protein